MGVMVSFSEDGVEVNTLSDNNSVLHCLSVLASRPKRTITIDNTEYSVTQDQGLGVLIINGDTLQKEHFVSFDVTDTNDVNRLVNHIAGIPVNRIVVIASTGFLSSNDKLDLFFKRYGSSSWPGKTYFSKEKTYVSYACVINTDINKITSETIGWSNAEAPLSVVFDRLYDIGACGVSKSLVNEIQGEITSNGNVNFHTFVDAKTSDLFLKEGDILHLKAYLKSTATALAAKNYSTITVNQYKNNSLVTGFSFPSVTVADQWDVFEQYIDIVDADKLTVTAQQISPPAGTVAGDVSVKNIFLTQVTRKPETRITSFGQHGIRTKDIAEPNPVLSLLGINTEIATSENFIES